MIMRRGFFSLTLLSLVVTALSLASWEGHTSYARETPAATSPANLSLQVAPTLVFQCYNLSGGDDVKVDVRLVTENFGGDLVRVRNLVMMCELAVKTVPPAAGGSDPPPPSPSITRIYACYKIERGADPNDPFVLTTANFGEDVIAVRVSDLLCEQATKTITLPSGQEVTIGQASGFLWQCYRLGGSDVQGGPFRLITNNFGRDDVRVGSGARMCETAAKFRLDATGNVVQSGVATGDVFECFRLGNGDGPAVKAVLETRNFGRDEVEVRRSSLMCEPATKVPVFDVDISRAEPEPDDGD
jgi:hypothetical protein